MVRPAGASCLSIVQLQGDVLPWDAVSVLKRFLFDRVRQKNPDEDVQLAWQALSTLYDARGLHEDALAAKKAAGKAFRMLKASDL
mmetsp:Transcript_105749/g.188113  ORF Transcript_105749/g.188113 Transcript_105749/m.188113 type:complete len:85 (+) Transcript_105749:333-587(+)